MLMVVTGETGSITLSDLAQLQEIQELIISKIHEASKPFFYSDTITQDYFNCITAFLG